MRETLKILSENEQKTRLVFFKTAVKPAVWITDIFLDLFPGFQANTENVSIRIKIPTDKLSSASLQDSHGAFRVHAAFKVISDHVKLKPHVVKASFCLAPR